jgi:NAD+ synthase (glutamine-hydrolysing)
MPYPPDFTSLIDDSNGSSGHLPENIQTHLDNLLQSTGPLSWAESPVISLLQEPLGPRGQGQLGLAQINTSPGDLAGNARKILNYMRVAEALNLDLIAFPELALMGYPPRDIIGRHPFLVRENLKWLNALAERSGKTYALVGFVEPRYGNSIRRDQLSGLRKQTGKPYYNAMAILGEGKIQGIVRKCLIPYYGEFEDARQFESSLQSGVLPAECLGQGGYGESDAPQVQGQLIEIYGRRYGLSICEDLWNDADFFDVPLYPRDPIAELVAHQPDALINISASPSRSRKEQMKHNLCAHAAHKAHAPLIYVNQAGTVDEVAFDGASRVYSAAGELVARGKSFAEQLLLVNPWQEKGVITALPLGLQESLQASGQASKQFNAYGTSDLGRTYATLVQGIRDYFAKTGFQRAVLGLSGGLDSSVTVVLLADALGPENVLGLSMPSELTPTENRSDAEILVERLGIRLLEVPISGITQAFRESMGNLPSQLQTHWGSVESRSNAADNIQAISRATILRQIGNEYRALPVATSDKSEFYLGYATVNGDMSGALAPLGDLPKTKVRALARWMNKHRASCNPVLKSGLPVLSIMPENIISKPSGADLKVDPQTGQLVTAEQELMPYEFADEIIWRLEALHQSQTEMLSESFQYEQRYPLEPGQKALWLEIFFQRMSRAVFKWFVAPPILIVEGNGSIAKSDYHHPIVANRIAWSGHSEQEIRDLLNQSQLQKT